MKPLVFLCFVCLLAATPRAFALAGELKQPGVALPEAFPEAAQKRINAALNRKDCQFLGGNFINWFTTLRYRSDTKTLNLFLDDLAHCYGVIVSVSFVKALPTEGDWHVHHDAQANRFHVRVSLASEQVKLEDLVIPAIKGVDPACLGEDVLMQGYEEFDQKPGRGWRAHTDKQQFAEAARLIERYLVAQGGLADWQKVNLHFHAAQCLAMAGADEAKQKALEHLRQARSEVEPADSPIKWNDYVDATAAFLRSDLKELKAARERVAAGPKVDGKIPNLEVVDRLIQGFGKPYREVYGW